MWKVQVTLSLIVLFFISFFLVGLGLSFSKFFVHIDPVSQKRSIKWVSIIVISFCVSIIVALGAAVMYKNYNSLNTTNVWKNEWTPTTVYSRPVPVVNYPDIFT